MVGVNVTLLDSAKEKIRNIETDADGRYRFDNLSAGKYYLKIDTPERYTTFNEGTVRFIDGLSSEIIIKDGEVFTDAWISYVTTDVSVNGYVFNDQNKDGKKDSGELGIEGIEMGLYLKGTTNPIQIVKTEANGKYSLKKIPSSETYEVKVLSVPPKYQIIKNTNFDENGKSNPLELKPFQSRNNINLALSEEIDVSDIIVEPTELNQVVGDTGTLKVTLIPEDATDQTITYESKDSTIITVDENGKWEAKGVGTTEITVKSGNISKTVKVIVKANEVPVDGLTVEPKELNQVIGDTGKLKVTITPDNATDKTVTFESADPKIITVDANGNWTALAEGTTEITVKSANGKSDTVKVTVKTKDVPVDGLIVEPTELNQYVGDTGQLKVTLTPENATDKTVTYDSQNESIITVNSDGKWEAKGVGTTVITVKSGNISKTVKVTVKAKDVPLESITVEPKELNQVVGDKGTLKVIYTPSNTTNKEVTFTSVEPAIITVDANGNWEARKAGTTKILVMAGTKMEWVEVTVSEKDIPLESITVEPKTLNQVVGDKGTLKVIYTPSNTTNKEVTFTSVDPTVITVDANGNWEAKKVGTTKILVMAGTKMEWVEVTVSEKDIPLESITVEPKVLNQVVGDKGTLKVIYTPSNTTNKEVTFTSVDPTVITVDANGNWEAKKAGTTKILVMAGTKMEWVEVTVSEKDIPLESITVEPKRLDQVVGDKGTLKVIFTPSNTTNKEVTYTSIDPSIITVDANGNWEAKKVGTTKILVMAGTKMEWVEVTVSEKDIPLESITVEPKELNQVVGDKGTLKVIYTPSNATNKEVTYTSVDPSIITVDANGNWEAKKVGTTKILVMAGTKMEWVEVTVSEKDIPVETITVEPRSLDQYVGDTGTLKVTITPDNATDKNVTFTSNDPAIMTVDANGNWEAKKVGTTVIIVKGSNGKTTPVQVTVREKNIPLESITVETERLDQLVGDKGTLKVIFNPSNATNKEVTFTSVDPSIITVDANGNWEAKKAGATRILVLANEGKMVWVEVTVSDKDIPVESITVEPERLDQLVGDTGVLKVTITPNNATNKNVLFTSNNLSIITVDANGNWEAKAVGETSITVRSSNGKVFVVPVTVNKKISQGVSVSYYDYPKFLGMFELKGTGTATNFDDNYGKTEPYPGLGTDNYKVTKVGYVKITETGLYKFSIAVDDNATVYIDDEQFLKRDTVVGGSLSNTRYLKAGQTIKIKTEHYHKISANSYFQLRWWKPSNPYSPLPIPDSEIMMEN
ncbi:hypothetical protein C240_246 [Enterococcus sp. 5H]|nr:hypothetical protein [Enterococcus sp. 5H]